MKFRRGRAPPSAPPSCVPGEEEEDRLAQKVPIQVVTILGTEKVAVEAYILTVSLLTIIPIQVVTILRTD